MAGRGRSSEGAAHSAAIRIRTKYDPRPQGPLMA